MIAKVVSFVAPLLLIHVASSSAADVGGQFVYQGFTSANLTLDGLATVTPGGLLALTNVTFQATAHAFHPAPVHFLNASSSAAAANATAAARARSFSTCFVFAIVSNYDRLSDNGLAFVVAPTTNFSAGKAGQYLGLLGAINGTASDRVLAVELDTIMNPDARDINSNHVGVDVNSLISEQPRPAGYYDDAAGGAWRDLQLNSREPMQVWIDYDGLQAGQLNVTLAPVQVPKPTKPLISVPVDPSTFMVDTMYIGFSSATGAVPTHHYVLGWSFSLDGPAPPLYFSKLPVLPRVGPKPRSKVLEVLLPLATALLVAAVLAAVFVMVWRRRRYAEVREDWEDEFGPHRFSYKDLFHATNGFKDKNLLGVGGFGRVYKGVLAASSLEIAVKRVSHNSRQGVREFVAEVVSIGRLRHRNLVQLLGYCRRKGELLLVYDYMANGSLDKYLHDQQMPTLSWHERYKIIKGVAASLLYLHEDWEQVVIHRDIKASNVLLDHEMNGRLGDFGLARLYDHGTDPQTTHVVGTMGYLAPELVRTGKATPLTDVFSFGVFLMEVACGRRPIDRDDRNNRLVLVDRVIELHRGESILDAVDPRLVGKYDTEEATLVLKLGLVCAHPLPNVRPSMRRVMQYLDSDQPVPDLSPSYMSYSMMSLMQNEGFDSFIMSSNHSNPTQRALTSRSAPIRGCGRSSSSIQSSNGDASPSAAVLARLAGDAPDAHGGGRVVPRQCVAQAGVHVVGGAARGRASVAVVPHRRVVGEPVPPLGRGALRQAVVQGAVPARRPAGGQRHREERAGEADPGGVRPRRPAATRRGRVLHPGDPPHGRCGHGDRGHRVGRHARAGDVLAAGVAGRRPGRGPSAGGRRTARQGQTPVPSPRPYVRHREDLLSRRRHPADNRRHGGQQDERVPLAHHGLPIVPHRAALRAAARREGRLRRGHEVHRRGRQAHRRVRHEPRRPRRAGDRLAGPHGVVGRRIPGGGVLRGQVLAARRRLEQPSRGRAWRRAAQPAGAQDVRGHHQRRQRPDLPLPGRLLPRRRRRDHPGLLAGGPHDPGRPGSRRHAEPAPGALRQRGPPPRRVQGPHGGVLGGRAAGRRRERELVGDPAGDDHPADVEQRAQQHEADRAGRVPRHRLLGVLLLPRLRPRRLRRQQQRLRRPQQRLRHQRRVLVRSLQDVAAGVRLRHRVRAHPRGGPAGHRRRGGDVDGAGRHDGAGREGLAENVGHGGGALVRQPRRGRQEAIRRGDRPAHRLAQPHGGERGPGRAHPAVLVPDTPRDVQRCPVTTRQKALTIVGQLFIITSYVSN